MPHLLKFFVAWMLVGSVVHVGQLLWARFQLGAEGRAAAIRSLTAGAPRWAFVVGQLLGVAIWPIHIFWVLGGLSKKVFTARQIDAAMKAQREAEGLCPNCGVRHDEAE